MGKYTNILFFITVILATTSTDALPEDLSRKEDTLQLLHVLFRHGSSTPDKEYSYPKDIYINETYGSYGCNELTLKGKQTQYAIGKYLRQTYSTFLPTQYTQDVVYSVSTNVRTTKMSLDLVLSSLFPPQATEKIDTDLNWQPCPSVTNERDVEVLKAASSAKYTSKYCSYVLSKEAQTIISDYTDLYAELSVYAGYEISTPRDLGKIYFTLKSQDDYGLSLPFWAAKYYPDILEEALSVDYEFSTSSSDLLKLSSGNLLKKILKESERKRDGKLSANRKIYLYSAHDYNIAQILRSLNVFYRHVPPFGATIFFEIHNIDGEYALKLSYQDYKATSPRVLTIPGCSSYCTFTQIYQLIGNNLPPDTDSDSDSDSDECECKD